MRIETAWANRQTLDVTSVAGQELMSYLDVIADQPVGALQRGMFYLDRGAPGHAEAWIRKAIAWDPNSGPFYHALAVALSTMGRFREAIEALEAAERLEPENAEYPYAKGLAYAEMGNRDLAIEALERVCELAPEFARAWYNLGLARVELGDVVRGLADLARAEAADPRNPEYPYTRATVHFQRQEFAAAREAAARALQLAPDFQPAREILTALEQRPPK